jgi:hypothetical protein
MMNQNQEPTQLKVVAGINPVAVVRAAAKARCGCKESLAWLEEQHRSGNSAATQALGNIHRRTTQTLVA